MSRRAILARSWTESRRRRRTGTYVIEALGIRRSLLFGACTNKSQSHELSTVRGLFNNTAGWREPGDDTSTAYLAVMQLIEAGLAPSKPPTGCHLAGAAGRLGKTRLDG